MEKVHEFRVTVVSEEISGWEVGFGAWCDKLGNRSVRFKRQYMVRAV